MVERLREIGAGHAAAPAQVALAWLLSWPFVASVLVGASKLGQLDDNLGAANLRLTDDETQALDDLTAPSPVYPHWFNATIVDAPVRDALTAGCA